LTGRPLFRAVRPQEPADQALPPTILLPAHNLTAHLTADSFE
jgi:hypothetical protein